MKAPGLYTRLVATVLLAAYAIACTGYQTVTDPAAQLQAAPKQVGKLRVSLKDGERFELSKPQVYGDTLRGFTLAGKAKSVAMDDVAKLETAKVSAIKTVALVAGIAVVGGLVVGALAAASASSGSCSLDGIEYTGGL